MRHYRPDETAKVAAAAPVWRRPTASATLAYDDLGGRFRLEWKGEPDAAYRLQYQAGEGLLSVAGEMEVIGTAKDFGIIQRRIGGNVVRHDDEGRHASAGRGDEVWGVRELGVKAGIANEDGSCW
jgi:hypothetical protein